MKKIERVKEMKGNNGTGNVEERDKWQTPQWLFDELDYQYKFSFDCCAKEDNKKCKIYTTDFEKCGEYGIDKAWMNPPFSKAKKMFKHFFKVVRSGVAIYRCDNMETKIWQEIILPNASWIFVPDTRICYEGMDGRGSRFPSALIGVNVPPPKDIDGIVLFTKLNEVSADYSHD